MTTLLEQSPTEARGFLAFCLIVGAVIVVTFVLSTITDIVKALREPALHRARAEEHAASERAWDAEIKAHEAELKLTKHNPEGETHE
jgi:hypothetical protein